VPFLPGPEASGNADGTRVRPKGRQSVFIAASVIRALTPQATTVAVAWSMLLEATRPDSIGLLDRGDEVFDPSPVLRLAGIELGAPGGQDGVLGRLVLFHAAALVLLPTPAGAGIVATGLWHSSQFTKPGVRDGWLAERWPAV
jgi:hypothetical protein